MSATLDSDFKKTNIVKTKFWGVTCDTGLKYCQLLEKKYCITQAVLQPVSVPNPDYVLVMFIHDEQEYVLAVLKQGEIQQVNLNMHFDQEKVTFYLKGKGRVHLLGYEVLEQTNEVCNGKTPISAVGIAAKVKKERHEDNSPMMISCRKQSDPEPSDHSFDEEYPQASCSKDPKHRMVDGDDDDDDEEEDDDDFLVTDVEEEEDDEDDSEDVDEEIDDSEIEKLEEDLEDMEDIPEPSSSRRKKVEPQQDEKHQKSESVSRKRKAQKDVASDDEDLEDLESDPGVHEADKAPPKKKAPDSTAEAVEKMKLLKKMKKQGNLKKSDEKIKLNKSQQTKSPASQKLDNGLEIEDLKVGHGPAVTKGKMVHVYYVGRLADKTIFDSRTRGNKPFSFVYGAGKVIKGWELGLQGMKAGGKRKLKVPPTLGYGKAAIEGIPVNSTLYFVVEVIAVS